MNKKSSGLLGERPEIPLAQQQAQAAQAASAGQLQQQQGAPPVPPQHQAPPPPPHDQTGQIMVQADYQYQNSAYAQAPVEASNWNGRPRDDYSYHMKQSNMVDQSSVVMVST